MQGKKRRAREEKEGNSKSEIKASSSLSPRFSSKKPVVLLFWSSSEYTGKREVWSTTSCFNCISWTSFCYSVWQQENLSFLYNHFSIIIRESIDHIHQFEDMRDQRVKEIQSLMIRTLVRSLLITMVTVLILNSYFFQYSERNWKSWPPKWRKEGRKRNKRKKNTKM